MIKKLSIIIPAWNEEKTITQLVEKVLKASIPQVQEKEIIIINDGSKDNTMQRIKELEQKYKEVHAFENEKNVGKTQTVKNGILKSTGELVIIQDADFEYDPEEIQLLVDLLIKNDLDVVYGDRFGKKNGRGYMQNYLGNIFLSFCSNIFTYPKLKVWIPDMEVCYKLIKGDVAREVGAKISTTSRFGLEPEITARLAKYKKDGHRLKFGIVPISYFPRTKAEGKKMNVLESGFKALLEIIRYNI